MSQDNFLEISWETVIRVFLIALAFYFIFLVRGIALWFFFALIISVLLDPAINFFKWLRLPKIIAVVLVYLSIFGVLGFLIYLTAPIFILELKEFSRSLPKYLEEISPFLRQFGVYTAQNFQNFSDILNNSLEKSSTGVINAVMSFFGGLASTASILTLAFFLSLEEKATEKVLVLLTPKKYEEYIKSLFERVQDKIAGWFGARLLACLFVGLASYLVFFIFGVKYAFTLALISGVLNFIPYIGPWITSILLIVFVAVSSGSWYTVIYILIAVTIIQEIENKILTPMLMKRMINLPPALVLISLLVGSQVFGFLGTIFAVPAFGIIYEFIKEFLEKRRLESTQAF